MPRVFIIILNWNGSKDTIECLNSLEALDFRNFEIILVDNGSTDDSISNFKIQIPNFKNKVILIENKENLGFPAGNNVGIRCALNYGADYILLLNSDTVVDSQFLKELVVAAKNNQQAGILGPKIYFFDAPKTIWFAGGKFNWFQGSSHIGFGVRENHTNEGANLMRIKREYTNVDFITGCAMLVKKEVFAALGEPRPTGRAAPKWRASLRGAEREKIGLLDERFFLYYEDTDFCLKAKKAGFKSVFVPRAKIWHKIPLKSLKTELSGAVDKIGAPPVYYYHHRNVLLLIQNNGPWFIKTAKHFWVLWKLIKQGIKIIFFPEKRASSLAIARGFFDYYRGHFGQIRNSKSEISARRCYASNVADGRNKSQ